MTQIVTQIGVAGGMTEAYKSFNENSIIINKNKYFWLNSKFKQNDCKNVTHPSKMQCDYILLYWFLSFKFLIFFIALLTDVHWVSGKVAYDPWVVWCEFLSGLMQIDEMH